MSPEALYLAGVLGAALVFFYTGWLRTDLTALLVMLALLVPWRPTDSGLQPILTPQEGFSGFGSPAVVMVASMFVLSAAMVRTGAAELIGRRALRAGSHSERLLQITILVVVTLFSAVINDTTTVLLWMPLVLQVCRERNYAPSRFLLPLAYASLLGGQWTLIGTRSNIIISDYLAHQTGAGLPFFSFTPVAVAVWAAALGAFLVFGHRVLPRHRQEPSLAERYEVTEYLTEVMATPSPEIANRTLAELDLQTRYDVTVIEVLRGQERLPPSAWLRVLPGDVFVVQGVISKITDLLHRPGFQFKEELQIGEKTLRSVDLRMVEALVAPNSPLINRSLQEVDFPRQHGLSVLAVGRHGRPLAGRPLAQRLHFGDSLLLVGHEVEIERLRRDPSFLLLESRSLPAARRIKALTTLGLMAAVIVLSALRVLEPTVVIPCAAVAAVLTRCIGMRAAYAALDLPALVTVGAMIPFGLALEKTGTAERLAEAVAGGLVDLGPHVVLGAMLLAAVVLTQVIDNAAVAIILSPVAFEMAQVTGCNPTPFLLGLAICVSAAFMTPVAHESTILVMSPGGYRFRHYLLAGTPLAILTWLVTTLLVPVLYPLR